MDSDSTISEFLAEPAGAQYSQEEAGRFNRLSRSAVRNNPHQALHFAREALRFAEEAGDDLERAISLCNIGACESAFGNYDRALEALEESLRLCEEQRNESGTAAALYEIGTV